MFPVRLSQILVQHNTVQNCANSIYAINQQENQPRHIARLHYQAAYRKQHYKSNADTSHIPSKALRLTFGPKIKEAEDQNADNRHSLNQ